MSGAPSRSAVVRAGRYDQGSHLKGDVLRQGLRLRDRQSIFNQALDVHVERIVDVSLRLLHGSPGGHTSR